MPHKYNADRRNGIPKQKYRVTNWAGYNEGLRRRVDLTVWITDAAQNPTTRDCDIARVNSHGRMAWQNSSGYNQRSRIETQMGRWKAVIGAKLKARVFENQRTEAGIDVQILNRMTGLGRPIFERTA